MNGTKAFPNFPAEFRMREEHRQDPRNPPRSFWSFGKSSPFGRLIALDNGIDSRALESAGLLHHHGQQPAPRRRFTDVQGLLRCGAVEEFKFHNSFPRQFPKQWMLPGGSKPQVLQQLLPLLCGQCAL